MRLAIPLLKDWGKRPSARRLVLPLTAALVFVVHAVTLLISPPLWQDEVQIVDLGRQALHPADKTWSLSWIAAGRPVAFINYLGPVMQELAYEATAPSPAGPRLSTVVGALLAACFAYGWLRSRDVPWRLAWMGCVLLLLDPQFVASYRGARVDSWVFAFMLSACWAARQGAVPGEAAPAAARQHAWRFFVGAGFLAGVAFFVWPSAFYLYPLLVAELAEGSKGLSRATLAGRMGLVALGGIAGVLACLVPVLGRLPSEWGDIFISKDAYLYQGSLARRILSGLVALPLAMKLSPFLPVLALGAVVLRRNLAVAVAAACTLAVMLPTQIYAGRVVYLLPYMIVLTVQAAQELEMKAGSKRRSLRLAALAAPLLWAAGLSLIGRPVNAWAGRQARDPELLSQAVAESGTAGHERIYLGAWEFYYAGRAAGWEMFVPYGKFSVAESARLYRSLDGAIVRGDADASLRAPLVAAGLNLSKEIRVGAAKTVNNASLRAAGYGTYDVYVRDAPH